MTTTKIITNSIYYLGLTGLILFGKDSFALYFVLAGILVQLVIITTAYRYSNRVVPHEEKLINHDSVASLKELLLIILFIICLVSVINFIFKLLPLTYLILYISIGIISIIIQYFIGQNKPAVMFWISGDKLIANDFFLRTYNLQNLTGIGYDGYSEIYLPRFGSKKVVIKQGDYDRDDLHNFLTAMIAKSKHEVELSQNIKEEILTNTNTHGTL